ncbi:MAG: ATP-dependent Clp protease adaptor ClpS, partial [Flavobacteriales bacterium]
MNFSTQSEELTLEDLLTAEEHQLILFNDDVNTFDFVIESLVSICRHDPLQAEQCALIVHYKGKCAVKNGTFDDLEPMCT